MRENFNNLPQTERRFIFCYNEQAHTLLRDKAIFFSYGNGGSAKTKIEINNCLLEIDPLQKKANYKEKLTGKLSKHESAALTHKDSG